MVECIVSSITNTAGYFLHLDKVYVVEFKVLRHFLLAWYAVRGLHAIVIIVIGFPFEKSPLGL